MDFDLDLLIPVAWCSLLAVVVADVLGRRRAGESPPPPPPPPRAVWTLAAIALLLAAARVPFAVHRAYRSVDEAQYAASAAFCRDTGASLFETGRNLGGHQFLYLLSSWGDPFTLTDVAGCLAIGVTSFLLGLTVLRSGGGFGPAVVTLPMYALGLVRFEGLSTNKEMFVNVFLAAYLLVRMTRPPSLGRQVLGGACLGLAVVMKEQAAPFVLLEAFLALRDIAASPGAGWRSRVAGYLRLVVPAALGFWVPAGLFLGAYAYHGSLGPYLDFVLQFGRSGSTQEEDLLYMLGGGPPLLPVTDPGPRLLTDMGDLLPAWASPVGLLGLAGAFTLLVQPSRLVRERQRAATSFTVAALIGLLCVWIGHRRFPHYFQLAFVGLAPLAAAQVFESARALRQRARRLTAAALLGLALVNGAVELWLITRPPVSWQVQGGNPMAEADNVMQWAGEAIQRHTSPDDLIFVWGWRPEVFFAADRRPASRYVGGLTCRLDQALADLERRPPAVVVLPTWQGITFGFERDPYDLAHHPRLRSWLEERGYAFAPVNVRGYLFLVRPTPPDRPR